VKGKEVKFTQPIKENEKHFLFCGMISKKHPNKLVWRDKTKNSIWKRFKRQKKMKTKFVERRHIKKETNPKKSHSVEKKNVNLDLLEGNWWDSMNNQYYIKNNKVHIIRNIKEFPDCFRMYGLTLQKNAKKVIWKNGDFVVHWTSSAQQPKKQLLSDENVQLKADEDEWEEAIKDDEFQEAIKATPLERMPVDIEQKSRLLSMDKGVDLSAFLFADSYFNKIDTPTPRQDDEDIATPKMETETATPKIEVETTTLTKNEEENQGGFSKNFISTVQTVYKQSTDSETDVKTDCN